MSDKLILVDDEKLVQPSESWKLLLVDDEKSVLEVTSLALRNKIIDGKKLQMLLASSAYEAKKILCEHNDIALALIDVVMETPEAGLELVNYIRNDLNNKMIRLVLRTGQPNQAPEEQVINHYDINDYKEKTELTAQKLYTLVRSSIKQYQQYLLLKQSRDDIYTKMTTSELTQLPNRTKLNEILDCAGKQSLILIDIDNFSLINDSQGFDMGDQLLKSFAIYLNTKCNNEITAFHLQSDVFVLLCSNLGIRQTHKFIENIKSDVASQPFKANNNNLRITVSIGIVLNENGNLIQKAEFALKEARKYGKNHEQIYSDDLNIIRTIHANSLWTERVRNAIEENRIHAYFQAIQQINSQHIDKYEALVRMEYKGEIISPVHFLDAALYSGQIYDIFKIMFTQACAKAKQDNVNVSINVSDYDLCEPDFFDYIKKTIKQYQLPAKQITLEILEHKSISNKINIQKLLNEIHEFGFTISIDDFGAHCSNFAQLNNLAINYIKIDGSFIKDIVTDKNSQIVSHAIIDYAHQKGIPVVAEFVCSKEVYDYVKSIKVDYMQGYYIGKPKP
jgi:diguanylate cyclase (GGDEF)-like protein